MLPKPTMMLIEDHNPPVRLRRCSLPSLAPKQTSDSFKFYPNLPDRLGRSNSAEVCRSLSRGWLRTPCRWDEISHRETCARRCTYMYASHAVSCSTMACETRVCEMFAGFGLRCCDIGQILSETYLALAFSKRYLLSGSLRVSS
jgi:hypothetical protein